MGPETNGDVVVGVESNTDSDMTENKKSRPAKKQKAGSGVGASAKNKRNRSANGDEAAALRKLPKRAAACSNFKDKSTPISEESSMIETKREALVEFENVALGLTLGHDHPRPNRRLKDFIFHDDEGNPKPVEALEVDDLFISGVMLPLESGDDKEKDKGVRCNGFGRIESWAISGYEDGSPVIWVSTELADYDCRKPSSRYRKLYNLFYEKAHACVEVYKKLSRTAGGNPDLSLDELLAGVVRSMSDSKNFPHGASIKDFIVSQGEFIYNQLAGLDESSNRNDQCFIYLPVLNALRDEKKKYEGVMMPEFNEFTMSSNKGLCIDSEATNPVSSVEDEDMKLARLLQEEENWRSMNRRGHRVPSGASGKFYVKINEDEIANDYPLPAFYKTSEEETDEFICIDNDGSDHLPENILHNWALYNSDARLISLELLPMRPCADIDVTIFGSGVMTEGADGNGFSLEVDSNQSSSGSKGAQNSGGLPIYLSSIKEWVVEFGASMIFISIRTDMSWYRLGKPAKQYAPWFQPVLKTARLGIKIITMLKEESRVSRLSFGDIIKKLSEFDKDDPAFVSSNPAAVERYVVVHGQIILQQFAEFPDKSINNCSFVTTLHEKMVLKHHTTWQINKKRILKKGMNLNPRDAIGTVISKRKAMPATTTRLINSIWGEYYSNYVPEDPKVAEAPDGKEDDEVEEEQDDNAEEDIEEDEKQEMQLEDQKEKSHAAVKTTKPVRPNQDITWEGEALGQSRNGLALYKQAIVYGDRVAVGDFLLMEAANSDTSSNLYFVEYMYENTKGTKMFHGRRLLRGFQTVLGNAANEREVFLTSDCLDFDLADVKETVVVEIRSNPWGYQHRKDNADKDRIDRERAEDRKVKGLSMEYYCKSLYSPERGAFFHLPKDTMGLGGGFCDSCAMKETQREKESFKLDLPGGSFTLEGVKYAIHDFVYITPHQFDVENADRETYKGGRNVGLRAFVVGQLLGIVAHKTSKPTIESTAVKIRRFFRPEDISNEKAYITDIREVYYSEQILTIPVEAIEGKCEVRKKHELSSLVVPAVFEHIFFCGNIYAPESGAVKQLPGHIKLSPYSEKTIDEAAYIKKKGKSKEGENGLEDQKMEAFAERRLATLDIFAGCGGLSQGLEQAGVSSTKWAIEYEEPAGEAFKLNQPDALVFVNNCNVILRAIMSACGDLDDCISTPEASELAEKLNEKDINCLPWPGEVEFINGGPPCQGFSGMNRFNQGTWSKVQCEMILAFLSFADYFRPRFFLLENVRNFVSFNKGQTFRLTIASLLEMGYQVRFGILEAGAYGVSQSRKRAFIWAASPEETLPEWPEPMHVFAVPELKITLSGNTQYAAVRSTANGAPFRAITVRDAIGDLPPVENGASATTMEYKNEPVSWFQKQIRGNTLVLTDHISKEMNELNQIRCKRIPKRPGVDWRDLPDEKVRLSTGQMVDLVPWCLPNTAKRHNQWKGLFGRLDWEGNFPTSVTDPQPMGKVGMCFHPEQDRIITVRECARSQGFPDSYKFAGNIQHKHRQIGNAVPPPLAFALGRKLKEAVQAKKLNYPPLV